MQILSKRRTCCLFETAALFVLVVALLSCVVVKNCRPKLANRMWLDSSWDVFEEPKNPEEQPTNSIVNPLVCVCVSALGWPEMMSARDIQE